MIQIKKIKILIMKQKLKQRNQKMKWIKFKKLLINRKYDK